MYFGAGRVFFVPPPPPRKKLCEIVLAGGITRRRCLDDTSVLWPHCLDGSQKYFIHLIIWGLPLASG
jgi:hypothetical protein